MSRLASAIILMIEKITTSKRFEGLRTGWRPTNRLRLAAMM
jgi:hypothetical protein